MAQNISVPPTAGGGLIGPPLNLGSYTINPSSTVSGSNLGIYQNITPSDTGLCTTGCKLNWLGIASDTIAAGSSNNVDAYFFQDEVGGSAMTGNRAAGRFKLDVTATTGNVSTGSYGALAVSTHTTVNDNGTGVTAGTAVGQLESLNVLVGLNSASATNWRAVQGAEIDVVNVTGSSTYEKSGLQVVQLGNDQVAGAVYDGAIAIDNGGAIGSGAGQTVGWTYGLALGGFQGQWPFNSGSTAIGCPDSCGTLKSAIDFTGATIGSYLLKGPSFSIDGSGNVIGATFAPTSATCASGDTWVYEPAANQVGLCANGAKLAWKGSTELIIGGTTGNTGDVLLANAAVTSLMTATLYNTSANAAAQVGLEFGTSTASNEASIVMNGGSFSGGQGANALQIQNASTNPIVIGTGTEVLKFGSSGMSVANGTVATAMSSVGPTGAGTTIKEWLTAKDPNGVPVVWPVWCKTSGC